jgi:uroporphyrinogen-III synthase
MSRPIVRASDRIQAHPLLGRRIVLTRPLAQTGDFEARVRALGGEPVIAPAIEIAPPDSWTIADAALRRVGTYDWVVFTSANAVRAMVERADAIGVPRDDLRSRRLAVVGPATAGVAEAALRLPDFAPSVNTSEFLAQELVDVENARILLPRGDLAGDALPDTLRARGAFVDEIVVYRTVAGPGVPDIVSGVRESAIDALLFASTSAVRFVADALGADPAIAHLRSTWPVAVCLGPVTADAARESGFQSVVVADGTTQQELIYRVVVWFAQAGKERKGEG